ncbi:gibberellin 2-beta-dioxygenase 2-like [Typha angustifolia]|uniref:gibberellin 2-beta-dioxygenase 2-like n=1 Tax=Typha angustifolia TaxID=59011 RepID=UPI003C2FF217
MVAASNTSPNPRTDCVPSVAIPVVDLLEERTLVKDLIVRSCEELGFFKVINHGVPLDVPARMEATSMEFFSLPSSEKNLAGPANPLGYGSKSIGLRGDTGDVEYLLLPTNSSCMAKRACAISTNYPHEFSSVMNEYVDAVKSLACEILELLAEGLGLNNTEVFSKLIRDRESDSLLRLNHYLPCNSKEDNYKNSSRIGFGEHTDPQIITILKSNNVEGFQILGPFGAWVPVPPDPDSFFVNVGDALQVMTNGRVLSVRHRAMASSYMPRLSMVYFGAPPLGAWISPLSEMITSKEPKRYKSFTWGDYKKAMYTLSLGHNRLDRFQTDSDPTKRMLEYSTSIEKVN